MKKALLSLILLFFCIIVNAQKIYHWEIKRELYDYFYKYIGNKITVYEYKGDTISFKDKIKTKKLWVDSIFCYSKENIINNDLFGQTNDNPPIKYFYQKDNDDYDGYLFKVYFSTRKKDGKGKLYVLKPVYDVLKIMEKQKINKYHRPLNLYYDPLSDEIIFKEKSIYIDKQKGIK